MTLELEEEVESLERMIDDDFVGFPEKFPHDWRSARYECQQVCARKELAQLKQILEATKVVG